MKLIDLPQKNLYTQSYAKKQVIDGVKLISLKHFVADEGDFGELMRLTETGTVEAFPEFQVRQISRSRVEHGAVKGWHIHFNQDELWYVSPHEQLMVGLWDCREGSISANITMRINLGGGVSQLLYIPRGIAHGCTNYTKKTANLIYFMNNTFNADSPDEQRIPFDTIPGFWNPERD